MKTAKLFHELLGFGMNWEVLEKENLGTALAYQVRLNLTEIYQIPDQFLAKKRFMACCRWVSRLLKQYARLLFAKMVSFAGMVERCLKGIFAYWNRKTINAFLEGLNSVFYAVKRKARGYRATDNLITMLYFTAGKLRILASH